MVGEILILTNKKYARLKKNGTILTRGDLERNLGEIMSSVDFSAL